MDPMADTANTPFETPRANMFGSSGQSDGNAGGSGCVVHQDGALWRVTQDAVVAPEYRLQILVCADTGQHDIGVTHRVGNRTAGAPGVFAGPGLSLGQRTVPDPDVNPCSGEMAGHGIAHHTEPDKGRLDSHA